jgi:hypothetical protein
MLERRRRDSHEAMSLFMQVVGDVKDLIERRSAAGT